MAILSRRSQEELIIGDKQDLLRRAVEHRQAPKSRRTYGPIAVVAFAYGAISWSRRWLYEDGLINVRIVENLARGHGPVFNIGERVEAYTSPVQIFLLGFLRGITFGLVRIEDLMFLLGVGSAVAGVTLAMLGAVHLWAADDNDHGWALPFGIIAFVAVPAAWDFATSGHEGGLSYLWIGGSFWLLARRAREIRCGLKPPVHQSVAILLWLGSGTLVRPEYALYTLAIGAAWLWIHRDTGGSKIRAVATALSLTAAYQVFRMGYFGLLLPNTAVAKLDAGIPASLDYLNTFMGPYWIWVPLVVVAAVTVALLRRSGRSELVVVAAFVVPSILQVVYLMSIGGDYLNARLLLPPYFALVAPVAVIPHRALYRYRPQRVPTARPAWILGLMVMVLWGGIGAATLRVPWDSPHADLKPKWDARGLTIHKALPNTPSRRIEEYQESYLSGPFRDLARAQALGYPSVLAARVGFFNQQATLPPGSDPAIITRAIGAVSLLSYPYHVYDVHGLANSIASHVPPTGTTPGHVRKLPIAWFFAQAGLLDDPSALAAAQARQCGDLADLVDAAEAPMSIGRFFSNIVNSPTNTFLAVPADPHDAVAKFC